MDSLRIGEEDPAYKLTHTLQTHLGMVLHNGAAQKRAYPKIPDDLRESDRLRIEDFSQNIDVDESWYVAIFSTCLIAKRLPWLDSPRWLDRLNLMVSNISACCNPDIDISFLKQCIKSSKRLDLEQAAAVVISAIMNDESIPDKAVVVRALLDGLDQKLLRKSHMWVESLQCTAFWSGENENFNQFTDFVTRIICVEHQIDVEPLRNWTNVVIALTRIRRCKPRDRALFIPEWMFEKADMQIPDVFHRWGSDGRMRSGRFPTVAEDEGSIIVSRKEFNALQRRIKRHFRFWIPKTRLRRDIEDLNSSVSYCSDHILSVVNPSQDTLLVAHYFFAFQRRRQRKVVSDSIYNGFLAKGESMKLLQNNINIITAFEKTLSEYSGQKGVPITGNVLDLVDQCCLLMEQYVMIFAGGDRTKLVFVPGVKGGSGRGAVDQYNALCDILNQLRKPTLDAGFAAPGPVHKFLAKDIMWWNNHAFEDDAFANGKIPGWETWLDMRRAAGEFKSCRSLSRSSSVTLCAS